MKETSLPSFFDSKAHATKNVEFLSADSPESVLADAVGGSLLQQIRLDRGRRVICKKVLRLASAFALAEVIARAVVP